MWPPISLSSQLHAYLLPFLRYNDLLVKNYIRVFAVLLITILFKATAEVAALGRKAIRRNYMTVTTMTWFTGLSTKTFFDCVVKAETSSRWAQRKLINIFRWTRQQVIQLRHSLNAQRTDKSFIQVAYISTLVSWFLRHVKEVAVLCQLSIKLMQRRCNWAQTGRV